MSKPKYCLQCDDGTQLVHTSKDVTVSVGGRTMRIEGISGWHCPVCGESEFDAGEGKRYSAALAQLRAQAIKQTRQALNLTQADAGRLFGGGVSAFSAYEHGKTQPHKSTVLLLRLLERHPDLLEEVRQFA